MKRSTGKNLLSLLIAVIMLTSPVCLSACFGTPNDSSPDGGSTPPIEDTTGNSTGNSTGGNEDGDGDLPDTPPINADHVAIVDAAYKLSVGASLGNCSLTGVVTKIDTPFNGSHMMLTFTVFGRETMPIYCYKLIGDDCASVAVGDYVTVYGCIKNYDGIIEFDSKCQLTDWVSNGVTDESDPYANMTAEEFYASYTVAKDNTDAYYRSLHGFMSGELTVPDQAPTVSSYQPSNGVALVRNSEMLFSDNGSTYTVVDAYGNPAFNVYRDGAYITLEEVAAYVYAFGTYPKNHTTSKKASPASSIWGEYLRLNYSSFSGDTSRYPYEPELPNITGCGGSLRYYEMDIGTTGTDCDPSYMALPYNNGSTITRGAARIVYGKTDLNGNGEYELNEFHLFYTYNHYNDFQEYLNYKGGWGKMFGNVTGGGTISSSYDYSPTDYISIVYTPLPDGPQSEMPQVPLRARQLMTAAQRIAEMQ